jgi:hypothetical protein
MAYTMATEMLWREAGCLEDPTKWLNLVQCNGQLLRSF